MSFNVKDAADATISVGSEVIEGTLTRPADTAAYAVGDVLATATSGGDSTITFTGVAGENGAGGTIVSLVLEDDNGGATVDGDFELWLYSVVPANQNDNVAFAPTDAENEDLVGVYALPTFFDAGGSHIYEKDAIGTQFKCAAGGKDLYGVLVTRSAYTPLSAGKFTIKLGVERG